MTTDQIEHLQNLVKSPGWLLVKQWAEWEFGAKRTIANFVENIAADSDADIVQQVHHYATAARTARLILEWPERLIAAPR